MKALLIVDVQQDFCPGGALAVEKGDEVVDVINRLQDHFDLVVATKDWHPKGHVSFASTHGKKPGDVIEVEGLEQVLWPEHCLQGSRGAEFHPRLKTEKIAKVIYKGTDERIDSYSGFFDNGRRRPTGLEGYLRGKGVQEVFVTGLATDYCVKFTALDAQRLGFETSVIADATRAVNREPGDGERALDEMRKAGIRVRESSEFLKGASPSK